MRITNENAPTATEAAKHTTSSPLSITLPSMPSKVHDSYLDLELKGSDLAQTEINSAFDALLSVVNSNDEFVDLTQSLLKRASNPFFSASQKTKLLKAISKRAKVPVASLKKDALKFESVTATSDKDHLDAAHAVLNGYGVENVLESQGQVWFWDQAGVWKQAEDREIKQSIVEVAKGANLTAGIVSSILDLFKTLIHKREHRFDNTHTDINCLNGVLHYSDGRWQLLPHRRDDFRTTQLPIEYDPTATCPRFGQYLVEVFDGTEDKAERTALLLEGLGYTLVTSCKYEKFFMLIGEGANGKSVFLYVVAELIGRNQVSAVQPNRFDDRFQRAHLDGKLANIVTEIPEGGSIADAQLKSLVSGEMTTAEHKHKPPFDFRPIATHWFGTNHMPHSRDFSDALYRRAAIIQFPNTFPAETRDPNLSEKLKAECAGILNLALTGLARLIKANGFTECQSSQEMTKSWRLETDQVAQFLEQRCELNLSLYVESGLLYERYRQWADKEGFYRLVAHTTFTKRLSGLSRNITVDRGTNGVRIIRGLHLR